MTIPGEVYKAKDTRLDRTVAIKVLPEHLAESPERGARFEREAKVISKLNHPHICTLFDVGEQDGVFYLVMEYIEGETLAERLKKGALTLDKALEYGFQIADGMDKAHRAGIVHRDIKPANLILAKSGIKILDFGLAKPLGDEVVSDASDAPTRQRNITKDQAIIGTLQYMAPEQLEGKAADFRADIFAFGAVLFEAITGKRAFDGESQASLITAILSSEPPSLSDLKPLSPRALDHVVKRCMAKEPDRRWQNASDVALELSWIAEDGAAEDTFVASKTRALPWLAGACLGGVVAGLVAFGLNASRESAPRDPTRFTITLPATDRLDGLLNPVALSPDGRELVYSAYRNGVRQLFHRSLNALDSVPIPGTEGAYDPFFSPDGEWVGFIGRGEVGVRKVFLPGGPVVPVTELAELLSGRWTQDDAIVLSTEGSGLFRVPSSGGSPERLTTPDADEGELSHLASAFLPNGRALLFTVRTSDADRLEVLSLETGERKVLGNGSSPRFVESGHILFVHEGSLWAARFDVDRLELLTAPVPVAEGIGPPHFSVSDSGTLVYVPDDVLLRSQDRELVWVDRDGNEQPISAEPLLYQYPRISPDGSRVALDVRRPDDIWIWDFERETLTRLTLHPSTQDIYPVWTPDGERIIFSSSREGTPNIFWKAADGTGPVERLTRSDSVQFPFSISPDGAHVVFRDSPPSGGIDLALLSLEDERHETKLLGSAFTETNAEISPDGRWLTYESNASGEHEIYVQAFPDVASGRWQVSTEGGVKPLWARSGRELFFRDLQGRVMSVDVEAEPTFSWSRPKLVFEGHYVHEAYSGGRKYDVAPDGERFLMIKESEPAGAANRQEIVVVLDWVEELKRLVPSVN